MGWTRSSLAICSYRGPRHRGCCGSLSLSGAGTVVAVGQVVRGAQLYRPLPAGGLSVVAAPCRYEQLLRVELRTPLSTETREGV